MVRLLDPGADISGVRGNGFALGDAARWDGSQFRKITEPEPRWYDDIGWRSLCGSATVRHGNYLAGMHGTSGVVGVTLLDANGVTRVGGKTKPSTTSPTMVGWSDGTRLYAAVSGTHVAVTYSAKSAPFTHGEAVTQETSGATGWMVRDSGTQMFIMRNTGTWASGGGGAYTITGSSSGSTCEADSHVTTTDLTKYQFIQRSETGFEDFTVVHDFNGMGGPESIVNCGNVAVPAVGTKQVLLLFERNAYGTAESVWYNYPADTTEWTLLFTTEALAIAHFHGAMIVENIPGGATKKLLVFAGDNQYEASILHCDDIGDLIANPTTWRERWGLHLTGASRASYLAGSDYCYGVGPDYRVLSAAPDRTNTYIYWMPDSEYPEGEGLPLLRVNLVTGDHDSYAVGAPGMGWHSMRLSNGTVLVQSTCDWDGSQFRNGGDGRVRIYAVIEDGESCAGVKVLKSFERQDIGEITDTSSLGYNGIIEFPVTTPEGTSRDEDDGCHVWLPAFEQTPLWCPKGILQCGLVGTKPQYGPPQAIRPCINLVYNGRFLNATMTNWTVSNATAVQETSEVDAAGGNNTSLKVTPGSTPGAAWAKYTLPAAVHRAVKGNWITFAGRVKMTAAGVALTLNDSIQAVSPYGVAAAADWQYFSMEVFVALSSTSLYFWLYRASGADETPIYLSDVSIVVGALRDRVPRNMVGVGEITGI